MTNKITEEQKQNLLDLSSKAVEQGHQFLDRLMEIHGKFIALEMTEEEQDELLRTDEGFQAGQKDMDELHERMVEMGIA